MGMRWVAPISEDGSLHMLLIAGMIDASSEFEVIQRNLTMTYTGGQGITVSPGQEAPSALLSHVRISNHDIFPSVIANSGSDPDFEGTIEDMMVMIDPDSGEFTPVEVIISVEYEGHEPFETYSVTSDVSGTDSEHWLIEVHNGSGEWNSTTTFDLGLEGSSNFTDLNIRVTPANTSTAHSLTNGHTIDIWFSASSGYSSAEAFFVRIPQIHGFDLTEPMADTYGIQPGDSTNIGIQFSNSGNGDERFEFEFDDSELPEGWVRTGSTAHTLGAFVSATHSVIVSAPANASDEDFSIYMSAVSYTHLTLPTNREV